ncbi:MAG: DUF5615 family PIN-like protein [Candidatus Heimdallarchaeota archaeon]|nr:DUF5615 family PIN-like protein [Candidatus Heimdallarchaeota archaeon]MCK5047987.1 DUF5615 family PIN-like protein [Candidatus Heimdallarchaeota archaeon]
MRFIIDACVANSSVILLSEMGYNVVTSTSLLSKNAEDEIIYDYASENQMELLLMIDVLVKFSSLQKTHP